MGPLMIYKVVGDLVSLRGSRGKSLGSRGASRPLGGHQGGSMGSRVTITFFAKN